MVCGERWSAEVRGHGDAASSAVALMVAELWRVRTTPRVSDSVEGGPRE